MPTSTLLLIHVGPVQDFIASARKCRDLWFGSQLLSDLSAVVARAVVEASGLREDEALIFPGSLTPREDGASAVANKIQVYLKGLSLAQAEAVANAGKAAMQDALSEQPLKDKLRQAIIDSLSSKTAAKNFSNKINELIDEQPLNLREIFTSKEVQDALPEGDAGSLNDPKVRQALKEAFLSCPYIQAWDSGEAGENQLSASKSKLQGLARWAGYVPAPELPARGEAQTSQAPVANIYLLGAFPQAAQLPTQEQEKLNQCWDVQGRLSEEPLLRLSDDKTLSGEAAEIVEALFSLCE